MNWSSRTQPVKVGDRVCYSQRYLQSISCYTGDMPFGRGKVTGLETLSEDVVLAVIDWGGMDLPAKVNVRNLSRVTERGIAE